VFAASSGKEYGEACRPSAIPASSASRIPQVNRTGDPVANVSGGRWVAADSRHPATHQPTDNREGTRSRSVPRSAANRSVLPVREWSGSRGRCSPRLPQIPA
jgi:hypothetical protein